MPTTSAWRWLVAKFQGVYPSSSTWLIGYSVIHSNHWTYSPNNSERGNLGSHKKTVFFTLSQKTETSPPFFDHLSFFLIKIFLTQPRPPPPFRRKMVKKLPVFLYNTPIFLANYAKKSDKTLLDWVSPPPLVKKIWVFSDKDFLDWPRPPPLLTESKKNSFLWLP